MTFMSDFGLWKGNNEIFIKPKFKDYREPSQGKIYNL